MLNHTPKAHVAAKAGSLSTSRAQAVQENLRQIKEQEKKAIAMRELKKDVQTVYDQMKVEEIVKFHTEALDDNTLSDRFRRELEMREHDRFYGEEHH